MSPLSVAWHWAYDAVPSSIAANQCSLLAGLVPNAIILEFGTLPIPVLIAASILSLLALSHCAPSSSNESAGRNPWALLGSLPMHLTRAPVGRNSMIARFEESWTLQKSRTLRSYRWRMNAKTSSKMTRLCSKLDATTTHSRLLPCSGPSGSKSEQAMPATSADFPFPLATDSAAGPSASNAARMNFFSHGSTVNGSPS